MEGKKRKEGREKERGREGERERCTRLVKGNFEMTQEGRDIFMHV